MFDEVDDGGTFFDLEVGGVRGGDVFGVGVDEAGEADGGEGEGAHGLVDLEHVVEADAMLVGVAHVVFAILDDVVDVEELGALDGGGVADGAPVDVEAVLESIEVAGLPTTASLCCLVPRV